MKSSTVIKRELAERPTSSHSIRESTRQRLQNENSRRISFVENDVGDRESQSSINSLNLTNATEVLPITSLERKPTVEDVEDENQQHFASIPLKNWLLKDMSENPVERTVSIRCIFLRVGEIDTLNERYYAEILLEASWEEPLFKGSKKYSFDPNINWAPKVSLMNSIGDLNDEILYTIRYDKQEIATVTEHHKLKGTYWERMELQHFPMDVQDLSILVTTGCTNTEMIFAKNLKKPSGVNRQVFTDEQEWYLFEHVDIEITEQIDEYLDNEHNHSVAICSCHAARKYGYFMWNAYFLIFLITSASLTTFPIPLGNIQGRIQIACTLLLTSITFRWSCNRGLPTISYLTAVDVYAIGSIFSLCLLNIFHGVLGYVNYYISTNTVNATGMPANVPSIIVIDRWALVVFTILFFAYQIGTFIWMCLVPWKKRRMMLRKDHESHLYIRSKYNNSKATFIDVIRGAQESLNTPNNLPITSNTNL